MHQRDAVMSPQPELSWVSGCHRAEACRGLEQLCRNALVSSAQRLFLCGCWSLIWCRGSSAIR